jgi:hypothetical protein
MIKFVQNKKNKLQNIATYHLIQSMRSNQNHSPKISM